MDAQETRQAITQNLVDAGCGEDLIGQFWQLMAAGKRREMLALLAGHRKCLLDLCHGAQRKIDCLDYLVYQMNRKQDEEELHHGRNTGIDPNMG